MTEKIYILKDNQEVELKGAELEAFNQDRTMMHADFLAFEQQQTERQAKLDSAITKLKALGLTESEANVIIGLE